MRHFIAYHNTEKMGRRLQDAQPLRLLTNKVVNHLLGNTVWFVVGEGDGIRQYSLGSVFRVTEIGDAPNDGFKRFATGSGHVFQPAIELTDREWFPSLIREVGRFAFGVGEVKNEETIVELTRLAAHAGYEVPNCQPSTGDVI